jgi:hypothetical protein
MSGRRPPGEIDACGRRAGRVLCVLRVIAVEEPGGVMTEVADTWTGTNWFIEGDISDCFGSFDHDVMVGILSEHIHDNRFLTLVRNMLSAGYLEDWVYGARSAGHLKEECLRRQRSWQLLF